MGSDLIFACKIGKSSVEAGWNQASGKNNWLGVSGVNVIGISVILENGVSTCKFSIPETMVIKTPNGDNATQYQLSETKYHLLIATGQLGPDGSLTQHDQKQASADPVDLTKFEKVKAAGNILLKLHGALMVVAWMGSASCGMFFARYLKETWRHQNILGKDVWFSIHAGHMSTTFVLTVISFCIIVYERGFLKYDFDFIKKNPHPALGMTTVLCAFVNPFMATFRPNPEDTYRWLYNWLHWLVGIIAWFAGIVAIFLAGDLSAPSFIPTSGYYNKIFVFVLVHCSAHITFMIHGWWSSKSASKVSRKAKWLAEDMVRT